RNSPITRGRRPDRRRACCRVSREFEMKSVNRAQAYRPQGALRALALVSTSAAAMALFAMPAQAQDDASASAGDDEQSIIVTGSRIARPNYESVQPTLLLGEEQLRERAFTNVADALNEIPGFGLSDANGSDSQGIAGVGQNF